MNSMTDWLATSIAQHSISISWTKSNTLNIFIDFKNILFFYFIGCTRTNLLWLIHFLNKKKRKQKNKNKNTHTPTTYKSNTSIHGLKLKHRSKLGEPGDRSSLPELN